MAKSHFRVSAYDAPERAKPADETVFRIPIIDQHGNRRGHVHGRGASEATISRFGVHNAKLKKIGGKLSWAGESDANTLRRQALRREQLQRTAQGSVTHSPTKPALARRPERGG